MPGPTPVRHHGPREREKKERREGQEMHAEKTEHLERTDPERLVEPAAGAQMREGDPGVLVVPNQRRDETDSECAEEKIKTGSLEFAAVARDEREDENDRD